jgi:hypothetical protein
VHEGIHSLLYMQERIRDWGQAPELSDSIPRVISPWTGNRLSLASFLHACFVWYGLAHFWALASTRPAFDSRRIMQRLSQAACGFLRGPLVTRIEPFLPGIGSEVIDAIRGMQSRIVFVFSEVQSPAGEALQGAAS